MCKVVIKTLRKRTIFRIELEDVQNIVYLFDGNSDLQLGLNFFLPLPNRVEVSFNFFNVIFCFINEKSAVFFIFYYSSAVKFFFNTKLIIKLV